MLAYNDPEAYRNRMSQTYRNLLVKNTVEFRAAKRDKSVSIER
jgi:hypothetical protein